MIGGYASNWYVRPEDVIDKADLTYRERWLIVYYLGLEGKQQHTMKELAKLNGVTANRIKGALTDAFEKMKPVYEEMRANELA